MHVCWVIFVVPFLFDKNKSFAVVAVHCCQRVLFCFLVDKKTFTRTLKVSIWRILLHGTRLVALSCRFDILLSSCMLPAYFLGSIPTEAFKLCLLFREEQLLLDLYNLPQGRIHCPSRPLSVSVSSQSSSIPNSMFASNISDVSNDRMQELVSKHPLVWQNSHGGLGK